MASAARYRIEDVAKTPRGWRVRTRVRGAHVVRIAFPPGPRRKGAGEVVQILHPKSENPVCAIGKNPSELLIFGNPSTKKATRERAARIRGARLNPKRKKRNPKPEGELKQAVHLFGSFHGKDPKEIIEKHESAEIRKDYAALGDLVAIGIGDCAMHGQNLVNNWNKCSHIAFKGDGVKLASSPNGRQLYAIGGNQNLVSCHGKFEGVDWEKDFVDLGECPFIVYLARKAHGNFEPIEYVHEFGEKSGIRPQLMYDKLKRRIFFVGGDYFIDSSKQISPGIEN